LPASQSGENVGADGMKPYRPTVMLVAVIFVNKISFREEKEWAGILQSVKIKEEMRNLGDIEGEM
jgi:hypothetical protein